MQRFSNDDRVRIDIPDENDPDHDTHHGEHGTIIETIEDNAEDVTGDERDNVIYRVNLDEGGIVDVRWRDLRPPIDSES